MTCYFSLLPCENRHPLAALLRAFDTLSAIFPLIGGYDIFATVLVSLFGRDGHRREKPGGQPATAGIARGRAAVRLFPVFCSSRCLLCVLVCPSGEKLNMRKLASLPSVPSFVRTEPVGVMGNVCLATAAFCLANGRLPRPAVKPRAAFPTTLSISYLASCSPASVFSGGTPPSRREAEAGACLMLCVSGKNDTASLLGRKKLLKKQPAKGTFTYLCSVKSVSPEETDAARPRDYSQGVEGLVVLTPRGPCRRMTTAPFFRPPRDARPGSCLLPEPGRPVPGGRPGVVSLTAGAAPL